MRKLLRIFQLTFLAIVSMLVAVSAFLLIGLLDGGRMERWYRAPFTGSIGDEALAIELAMLPPVLSMLAGWGVVKLFRLRAINNEVNDTYKPLLTLISGYTRFVLIIVSAAFLLMGHGWAAAAHFAFAIVLFALFYHRHRVREQADHDRLQLEQEEGDDAPLH